MNDDDRRPGDEEPDPAEAPDEFLRRRHRSRIDDLTPQVAAEGILRGTPDSRYDDFRR